MKNEVDEKTIKELFDYYGDTTLPNPLHYPLQFQFLIDSFLHHKKMKNMESKDIK